MPSAREVRRIYGFLSARADRLHLDQVTYHRDPRGKRWKLPALLWASLLGILTGQKSLADVERLTCDLSKAARCRFRIHRRIPDTTLRDALATIAPAELRPFLHSVTRSALRSKSVTVDFDLPFGVVSMDGKYVTVPSVDGHYVQRSSRADGDSDVAGRIGTMTATLCSSEARPCIDVYLIPARTNEMGVFAGALDALLQVTRSIFLLPCPDGTDEWPHLRTIIRVASAGFDRIGNRTAETRYFLSSLSTDRWSANQWLTVVRRHWAVESTHQVLDVTFEEDDHPWVLHNPRLTATVTVLRRIGYSLLTIFRSVTQRSDHRRQEPWRVLLARMHCAFGAPSLSLGP